ncbi:MAG: transposase [Pseudomonadales bacterium]|jgi:REP element-mobilizing transposase RayT|nr:transposase [Pseudomonadales bacterium]
MEKRGSHRLRLGRRSIPGQIYHVRFSTHERRPLLAALQSGRAVILALRAAERRHDARTLCFVVMPDHVHWLLCLGEQKRLASVVGAVKGSAAREITRVHPRLRAQVWQRGFFDRALRREEDLTTVARYIVANPLRAGLVRSVRAWPHWDAVWL